MRVFVSWRGKDKDVKNKMVAKLKAGLPSDVEIWESDENCISDFSAECIEAIRESQVFVVIISDATILEDSYVQNEVQEARLCQMQGKLNMLVFGITDTPLSARLAGNLNHISDVNRVARMAGTDEGYDALVRKVNRLLTLRKEGKPEKPYEVDVPEIAGVSLGGPGFFVEGSRDDKIEEFDLAFGKRNVVFATQISGYGKKSVVRKYAEERRTDYTNIIAIHTDCSSLTDFFLSALHFRNINEDVYEGLDEKGIILKKCEFLSKLDEKTLLVVPHLEIGKKDGEFIVDALSGIKCRVIFIVERMSKAWRDILPPVEVGRMKDEHLKELFFHYYTLAGDDEQEELTDCLYDFFRDIGGHTKSVELVASALDEECDIYPEDIPDLFKEMNLTEMSELGERIFGVISEMYDIRNFTENERRTLLIASLIATTPIDRKKFIGAVKEAGAFDSETIKKLEQLRWLDCDTTARTVSIDHTLAGVCLKKIPMEKPILYRCISLLFSDYIDKANDTSYVGMSDSLRRLSSCLKKGALVKTAAVADCLDELLCRSTADFYEFDLSTPLFDEANAEIENLEDTECKDNLAFLISQTSTTAKTFSSYSDRKTDTSVYDSIISSVSKPEILETFEAITKMTSDQRVLSFVKSIKSAALSGNFRKLISTYIPTVIDLIEDDNPEAEITDAESVLVFMLTKIGFMLAITLPPSAPVSCQLCRTVAMLDNYYASFSPTERYLTSAALLKCLISMEELTEETEGVFARVMSAIEAAKGDKFMSAKDFFEEKNGLVISYANLLASKRAADALETLTEFIKPNTVSESDAASLVNCIESAAMKLLEEGDCHGFINAVNDVLIGVYSAETDKRFADVKDIIESLTDIVRSVEKAEEDTSFKDEEEEYLDYYKSYSGSVNSKRDTVRYTAVADKAKAIDFTSYTREELLKEADKLKSLAKRAEHIFEIAPTAFALVSEAGFRVLGYKHHYVQYVGGAAILDGKIAELQNGEGKTYTIVLAAITRVLFGERVTVADMSDYLAKRNYDNMRGVYEYLGINVLFCPRCRENPDTLLPLAKCDVLYGDMAFLIFAEMYSEASMTPRVLLKKDAIIVDEADQAMIEKARTPFSIVYELDIPISTFDLYEKAGEVRDIIQDESDTDRYFTYDNGRIILKSEAYDLITDMLGDYLSSLPPEAEKIVVNATRSALLVDFYEEGKDYFIEDGAFVYEERATGKFQRFSPDLQYFLAERENLPLSQSGNKIKLSKAKNLYLLTEYVKSFASVAGTTATAVSMKEEFKTLYSMEVFSVPTNVPVARVDYAPAFFFNGWAKNEEIIALTAIKHEAGQPVLIITSSIESSVLYANMLRERGIECTVLNAKSADKEAEVLSLAGIPGRVTVATALANRGVDILLGGDPRRMAFSHLVKSGKSPEEITRAIYSSDENGTSSLLKDNYQKLVSMYRQSTDRDRELADSLGGLCVIGTECFDDLRIEQQMRGRAGRQGRHGESFVFYSLDDDAVKELFGKNYQGLKAFVTRLCGDDGGVAPFGMLSKSIRSARLRLQHQRYGYIKDLPELHVRVPMREKLLKIKDAFTKDGERTAKELFKEYVSTNEALLKCFDGGEILNSVLFSRLKPYLSSLCEPKSVPKRRQPELLCRAFEAMLNSGAPKKEALVNSLYLSLDNLWLEYLGKMSEEISSATTLWGDKKLKKHLTSFSDNLFKELITAEITNVAKKHVPLRQDLQNSVRRKSGANTDANTDN